MSNIFLDIFHTQSARAAEITEILVLNVLVPNLNQVLFQTFVLCIVQVVCSNLTVTVPHFVSFPLLPNNGHYDHRTVFVP